MTADAPYYIDDPMVDRAAHRLVMTLAEVESAAAGRSLHYGRCSCTTMDPVGPWDDYAVLEAYDQHMQHVQTETRARAARS
ncbi:hypothetical protein [Micromonospora sp. WMMC273]|uniref:hypothetical protein n=1 Tax=Micromonospora sp. WMMC273 TaxID=3015157 RepID=UPI0022B75503|nr:hypothetical protein [Micromonospora sp. WMMC273]MCZ7478815.1 hypothetical protein [Micromonospora sp. WMMC273]MCZ7478943.1 hypothetical protein [Micromonospora sp. WMMC273]